MNTLITHFQNTSILDPIPSITPMTGWRELPIQESGEKLVALGAFSDYPHIFTDSMYFGERTSSPYARDELKGSMITSFAREGVAKMLSEASKLLPEGYALMVWDAYRPLEVQNALYTDYVEKLIRTQGMPREQAEEAALTFVSRPSPAPEKPSPHYTGGSVDLTIVKFDDNVVSELNVLNAIVASAREDIIAARAVGDLKAVDDAENIEYPAEMRKQELLRNHSKPIDVGANFDETKDISAVRYFEQRIEAGENLTEQEHEQAMNRRILQNVMRSVGFSSFDSEWWHLDNGNQFNSRQTGNTAKYGPIAMSPENIAHEKMRRDHFIGTNILVMQPGILTQTANNKLGRPAVEVSKDVELAVAGALRGDMTRTVHDQGLRL